MNTADRKMLNEARRLLEAGKIKDALARLMRLTEKYPDDTDVRTGLAASLVTRGADFASRGDFDRAAGDFERSLNYSPTPEAHLNLGRVHQVRGRFEDAFAQFTQALDMDEDLPAAHEAMGHYFLAVRDFDQSATAFGRAIAKGGDGRSIYLGLWEAYVGLGRLEQAHETIMEAAAKWPEDDTVLGTVALSWAVAKNDHAAAEEWWKKAVVLNAGNLPALFNLAGLAALRGQRDEALAWLRRCMEVDAARTREMWKEDITAPMRKFAAYQGDEDFLDVLGTMK